MKVILRCTAAILFLCLAIASFSFGVPAGGALFIVAGVVFEGLFWAYLLGKKARTKHSH